MRTIAGTPRNRSFAAEGRGFDPQGSRGFPDKNFEHRGRKKIAGGRCLLSQHELQNLLTSLDLIGTFTFAVTGAFKAVKYELDILGVLALAVITGVGGGILRDLLLGVTPPVVFLNEIYLVLCLVGGVTVFFIAPKIAQWWNVVKIFDAVGLGVFAALGALKGFEHHLGVLGTLLMGGLTAVGGGVIRDLLVREIPAVLVSDFYATAAVAGSLAVYGTKILGWSDTIALGTGAGLTIALRLLAMKFQFHLPRVKNLAAAPSEIAKQWWKGRDLRVRKKQGKASEKPKVPGRDE